MTSNFRTCAVLAALMIAAPAMAAEAHTKPDYCVDACTGRFCYFGSRGFKCGVTYNGRSCFRDNIPVIKQNSEALCSGKVKP
jgi:hypothetical protein